MSIAAAYIAVASVAALLRGIRETNPDQKKSLYMTASYPLIGAGAGIVQALLPQMPIFCFGTVAMALVTFITANSGKVSNDPLTKLNNRNELNNYAARIVKDQAANGDLWLIIFDLDKFKPINDVYGHVEGDQALVKMADALRASCKSSQMHRNFIARFGGDEFMIVTSSSAERERIVEEVYRQLDQINQTWGKPYQILTSVGWAKYEPAIGSLPGWIKVADEMLYKNKEERKKNGLA